MGNGRCWFQLNGLNENNLNIFANELWNMLANSNRYLSSSDYICTSVYLSIDPYLSIYPLIHPSIHHPYHLSVSTSTIYVSLLDIMYPPIFPFPFFLFPFPYLSITHPSSFPLPLHSFSFLLFCQSIHPSTYPSIFSNTIMAQSLMHPHP